MASPLAWAGWPGPALARSLKASAPWPAPAAESLSESAQSGRTGAWRATGGAGNPRPTASSSQADAAPPWAHRLRAEQAARAQRHATAQAIKDGDKPGAAANPDLSTKEE